MLGRTRLPIAIQQGCDNHCRFCITKVARGAHRNIDLDTIISHIEQGIEQGVREVVLTGVNLAAWGASNSNLASESQLAWLLEQILHRTSIERLRLSSLGPQYLHEDFFQIYADERICDYLHLSMQSGSDAVLKAMARGHGTAEIERIAVRARAVRPHTALAGDLITGFPGESAADHQQSYQLIDSLQFSKLHIFPYSEREGTEAARLTEQVAIAERKARAKELRQLAVTMRQNFIRSQMGRRVAILLEEGGTGLSSHYIRLKPDKSQCCEVGEWCETTLNEQTLAESPA